MCRGPHANLPPPPRAPTLISHTVPPSAAHATCKPFESPPKEASPRKEHPIAIESPEVAAQNPPRSVPLPVRPLYIHSCMCLVAVSVPTPRASGLCLFAVQCARACAFCIRTTLFALAANCFRSRDVTHPAGRPEPPTCQAVCSLGETAFADRDVLALKVRLRGRCSRQRESALTNAHSSERQTPRYEFCSEHRIYMMYMLSSERAVGEAETKCSSSLPCCDVTSREYLCKNCIDTLHTILG